MRLFTPQFWFTLVFFCLIGRLSSQSLSIGNTNMILLDGHQQRHVISAKSATQLLAFQNLIPGQTYSIIVPQDPTLATCWPDVSAVNPNTQVIKYDKQAHQLSFVASAAGMSFYLNYPCTWDAANPPRHYVTILCESCKKKDLKSYIEALGEITVEGGQSAEDLIKEVLIGGNCFDVTGVTFQGQSGQIGTFANGLTNVGFSTGVIMATGDVNVALGPNDQDNASAGYGLNTPDGDLATLTAGNTFDMANIEFDFTPTQTPVTFEFVFASEEYCEYVGSQFNDVFGFFISGPGITGTENIALIPNTAIPVAINNVNHTSFPALYVNNTGPGGTLCGQNPSNLPSVNELQFDGYTRRLVAVAKVQPCQTYHIKLKVADVGDPIFDSAVFLKAGSFDAGGNASVEWLVNGEPADETYEKCGDVQLLFDRVGGNINVPFPVQFTVKGTATSGLDYTPIPTTVIIPAGQDKLYLPVKILADLLPEGQESIIIKLVNACSCIEPTEVLLINDLPPLAAMPDSVTICGPGIGTVSVLPEGGVEPFTYKWSNNSTDPTLTTFASISTNYKVTVTDACGQTAVATARINVNALPVAQLIPPAPQLCPNGGSGTITVNFIGSGPFDLEYSINGNAQPPITGIEDDPFSLEVNEPGTYQIISVIDGAGCQGPGQGALLVIQSTLNLTGVVVGSNCSGNSNGAINTTVTGGKGPYNYTWSGPQTVPNNPDPANLQGGLYTVTVTDGFGCTDDAQFTVPAPPPIVPTIANVQGTNCSNPNGGSINLEVTGGAPGYTYKWSNTSVVQDPQNLTAGVYSVTISDLTGCTKTTSVTVPGNFTAPTAVATVDGNLTCIVGSLPLNGTGSSAGPGFSYQWSANPGNIISGAQTLNPTVNKAGTYTLVVTNAANGCTASAQTTVVANSTLPDADAGPTQTLTCAIKTINMDGSGSSTGADFSYKWTASNGGIIAGADNTLTPVVSNPGTYTILVTNVVNGCTKTDNAEVVSNLTPPSAIVAAPGILTCSVSEVTLNGSASTPNGGITYLWSTANGNIKSGQGTANPVVTEEGNYTLTVTRNDNGCTDDETVFVGLDFTDPAAVVTVIGELNCVTSQLTLNGNGSSSGPGYNFFWTTTAGGNFSSGTNTLTPVVNQPGSYSIVVTNLKNNCTATASILVTKNIQAPLAAPGAPATLTCDNPLHQIGDAAIQPLPNLSYKWTVSPGGHILSGDGTPAPTVDKPGTYTLLVTNSQNGCTANASVVVQEDKVLPIAIVAPGGQLDCVTPSLLLNTAGSSTGANIKYEWTTDVGNIPAGVDTPTPTVVAAGSYDLLITNIQNGCTATASTTVTSDAVLPDAFAQVNGFITCLQPEVPINGNGSSTGANISYKWGTLNGLIVSGQDSLQAIAGMPGQYTLLVTNTTNKCTATYSVDVPADLAAPVANAGTNQVLSCTQPSLTLNGTGSSQGTGFTYKWNALAGGNFMSPTDILNPIVNEPGTYELVVTNTSNGCTTAATVDVLQDAADPVVQIASPATLNCVTNQVTLNTNGSSTGSNFSYAWSGPGLITPNNAQNAMVTQAGTYQLVITNTNNGCTTSQSVPVNQDVQPPVADAGPDLLLDCYQPQQQIGGLNGSNGQIFSYKWTGPGIVSGADTPMPIIEQAGAYNVVITNTQNGCTDTDDVSVTSDQVAPAADAGPGFQLTCVNNTYTLAPVASQGPTFSYHWETNTGSFVGSADVLNPVINGAGTYYLTVTNATNGCTSMAGVLITQDANLPTAIAGTAGALTCDVATITLNAAGTSTGPNFIYQWTPVTPTGNILSNPTSLTPTVDQPGTYQLAVTDTLNSCVAYSTVVVDQDINQPIIDAGQSVILTCTQPTLSLQGDVSTNGVFQYDWQASGGGVIVNGISTLSPTINAVGTYTLTVTNLLNGCSSSDDVAVLADQNAPVAAIQQPGQLTCVVKQITLDATASSNNNITYTWKTNGGNFINLNNPLLPVVNEPGTYELMVTDPGNGCTDVATVQVKENVTPPTADAGANSLLTCAITSLQLDGAGSSQTGASYYYEWTSPNGYILSGVNSLTPFVASSGTYVLTVLNNDNGCFSTDQTQVNQDIAQPVIAIVTPAVLTCTAPQTTLNGSGSQGGTNISYAWSTVGGNILSGQSANSAIVNAAGDYTLTVLNNSNGCTNSMTIPVSTNIVLPDAEAGPPFTLTCSILKIKLQGAGSTGAGFKYAWSSTGGNIVNGANTLAPTVNEPGLYALTVTNSSTGCSQTDQVEVFEETDLPTGFELNLLPPGCRDNDGVISFDTVIGGVEPYVYSIDGGKTYTAAIDFKNIRPGNYDLWIQDANGCEYNQKLVVPKAPDPAVEVAPEFIVELGESLDIHAKLPDTYPYSSIDTVIWTPITGLVFDGTDVLSLLNPSITPLKTSQYTVKVISDDGCEASDRLTIRVDNEAHIYIPNVFSPWDENSQNDVVYIFADGDQVLKINSFQIFDRWGAMVFQAKNFQPNDPSYGWNGRFDGTLMNPAVFVYYAEIEMIDGRVLLFTGDITLLR